MKSLVLLGLLAGMFVPEGAECGAPEAAPSLEFETWWLRNAPALLPASERDTVEAGNRRASRNIFELLDAVQERGDGGVQAVFQLGLRRENEVVGHLRALVDDRLSGRHLAGACDRPVPLNLRAAAALALGLSGDVVAYQGLRAALLDPDLPEVLKAGVVLGLSYSEAASDASRFAVLLRDPKRRPLVAEAAAVALGRHFLRTSAHEAVLSDALGGPDCGAARGAAIGLAFGAHGNAGAMTALVRAASSHDDPTTRALALLAVSSRGAPQALALIDLEMSRHDGNPAFAGVALGLLGRANPALLIVCRERLDHWWLASPKAVGVARCLLDQPGPSVPGRARTFADLVAGTAVFVGEPTLGRLLDTLAALSH